MTTIHSPSNRKLVFLALFAWGGYLLLQEAVVVFRVREFDPLSILFEAIYTAPALLILFAAGWLARVPMTKNRELGRINFAVRFLIAVLFFRLCIHIPDLWDFEGRFRLPDHFGTVLLGTLSITGIPAIISALIYWPKFVARPIISECSV
jgi:hypothetical protein